MNPDVLCIGHAAYDITMSAGHHPAPDEKMRADAMQLAGGGPAANAAVCICRLDGSAAYCGYLGDDIFGEAHLRELAEAGVDTQLVVRGAATSPVSQILAKPDGTRSVVNYRGEADWLAADAVDFRALTPRVVLCDGHEPLLSQAAVHWARAQGIASVLDAGSVHRGTRELADQVDCLAASERFARDWCGTDDMRRAILDMRGLAPQVIITMGEAGLLWAKDGETGAMPAFVVDAVDSTGAGDAFHGALALGLARGVAWLDMLRFASAVGAMTCTRLGARRALPMRADAEALMSRADSG